MKNTRPLSEKLIEYQLRVRDREQRFSPYAVCFTNDFEKGIAFRKELVELIPDLYDILHVAEIDALIDYIYDKTCEDLRKKGFLFEESREILGR